MKIEKISDNQIRCTLNKNDLIDRELKISELAYGTEKAKALFRDMMQQASSEFGFEADDIPIMIEAIPISTECLVLNITKVEDPDELDTRFSKFSNRTEADEEEIEEDSEEISFADELLDCLDQVTDLVDDYAQPTTDNIDEATNDPDQKNNVSVATNLTKVYSFQTLDQVIQLAGILTGFYHGENILFKASSKNCYYLVITKSDHTAEDFNKLCNIISEYGKAEKFNNATLSYFYEHYEVIIKESALQILSVM